MKPRDSLAIWLIGACAAIWINQSCTKEADGWERKSPEETCKMIAELCPKRLATIDGLSCEDQVIASTPPEGSYWNKTAHNVEFGYGKNPTCVANVYYSQQYQQNPFSRGCEMLKSACECGKWYGHISFPYTPTKEDVSCNPRIPP